jgi:hypothetical protein
VGTAHHILPLTLAREIVKGNRFPHTLAPLGERVAEGRVRAVGTGELPASCLVTPSEITDQKPSPLTIGEGFFALFFSNICRITSQPCEMIRIAALRWVMEKLAGGMPLLGEAV